jgi:hypothetical protein
MVVANVIESRTVFRTSSLPCPRHSSALQTAPETGNAASREPEANSIRQKY